MPQSYEPSLPIDTLLPEVRRLLAEGQGLVLQAAPGAGKTTRLPLALLDETWLAGRKILLQEPRRIAARAAARRMAATLGEEVGERVGYRVRLDQKVGPRTRLEVVTDGILLRRLQQDPGLDGVGLVILDEFHERGLESDLAFALCRDAQAGLREDLRLLVMSATMDAAAIARLLGGVPVVSSEGRVFPVATEYLDPGPARRIEEAVSAAVRRALAEEEGSILVFLPGAGEIRRVQRRLEGEALPPGSEIAPLYGDLPASAQDLAIRPPPKGRRKIVLATSIAETSLTIEGVRVVIDAGLMRRLRFDPASGMSRLVTVRVTADSAEQRRGRAGRTEPGVCYRLWPEPEQRSLLQRRPPEIAEADLAEFALDLASWGAGPEQLPLPEQPPAAAFAQARELLRSLGALDRSGRLMAHGREMARLGLHPRLAHMLLKARSLGLGPTGAALAALLGERDLLRPSAARDADLRDRMDLLAGGEKAVGVADRAMLSQVRELSRQFRRQIGVKDGPLDRRAVGLLVAFAYPDRIAQRRDSSSGHYLLSVGRGARLAEGDGLQSEEFLAVADLDGDREQARIYRAAPLDLGEIERHFADQIEEVDEVRWDVRQKAVLARRQRRLGAIVIASKPIADLAPGRMEAALIQGVRAEGLRCLPWSESVQRLRQRIMFLRRTFGEEWPDFSDAALLAGLEDWLMPHLAGLSRLSHLGQLDFAAILLARLDWQARRRLDDLAPTHMLLPSGSRAPIDYETEGGPLLAVRLQELFGLGETPVIAGGRVPLLLHLLSPARRPVQVTRDLAGFWTGSYGAVRADLRGRYPKHDWPEDPLAAQPTSRAKRRES